MNQDPDSFEKELSELRPAKLVRGAMDQLETKLSLVLSSAPSAPASVPRRRGLNWLLWFAPAAAAAAIGILLLSRWETVSIKPIPVREPVSQPGLTADKVEIDRQLMTNFDAIARLPSGEPVRFRCEQWMDKVRVRDSAAGLIVERATPRLEIRPVRFETY